MPIGILFWVLMVLWFLFGLYWNRRDVLAATTGLRRQLAAFHPAGFDRLESVWPRLQ